MIGEVGLSYYHVHTHVTTAPTETVRAVVSAIADGKFKPLISRIRGGDKEAKALLPSVTWSGTFDPRTDKGLQKYSGLICLDYDKLPTPEAVDHVKSVLASCPHTVAAFVSPSGNGVKAVMAVAGGADKHKVNFCSLSEYADRLTGYPSDRQCVNLSRICYLSWDEDVYYNPDAAAYTKSAEDVLAAVVRLLKKQRTCDYIAKEWGYATRHIQRVQNEAITKGLYSPPPPRSATSFADNLTLTARADKYATEDGGDFVEGNRHNWAFRFAGACNRLGVPRSESEAYLAAKSGWYPFDADIERIYNDTYGKEAHRHGEHAPRPTRTNSYSLDTKTIRPMQAKTTEVMRISHGLQERIDTIEAVESHAMDHLKPNRRGYSQDGERIIRFWRVTDEKKGTVGLLHATLMDWLASHGFARIASREGGGHLLVRVGDGCKVTEVTVPEIKGFILSWLDNQGTFEDGVTPDDLREIFVKGDKTYLSDSKLEWLPCLTRPFAKDTRNAAYLFYANTVVKVTANGAVLVPWEDFNLLVWDKWILPREYALEDAEMSVFGRFIEAMQGEGGSDNKPRSFALQTAIGYVLHGWKDPSLPKAVVITDELMPEDQGQTNGGTGKTLVTTAIGKMRTMLTLSKQEQLKISTGKDFALQRMTASVRVINLNDLPQDFNFVNIFDMLTEGTVVERKQRDSYYIPYEDSPKFIITSNFTVADSGTSVSRRKCEYQAYPHYTPEYGPADEFGQLFFDDWSEAEWQAFDAYMIECVRLFLENGLVSGQNAAMKERKLAQQTNQAFADYVEPLVINPSDSEGQEYDRRALYQGFITSAIECTDVTQNLFNRWLSVFCAVKGCVLRTRRDTDGIYWVRFVTAPKRE